MQNERTGYAPQSQMTLEEHEIFTLHRATAKGPKPKPLFGNVTGRQGVLFAGSNCIAGQGELFNPNGKDAEAPVAP